jgi:ADP-ribose pyrophosphatase
MVTHTGPVFAVETLTVLDRAGHRVRKDVVRHPGAVTVIAVDALGRLVMVRNWRIAVASRLLEFCAGKLERGEDPAAAAGRELEEECGMRASRVRPLGTFYTSPGFADEIMHVFVADDLHPVAQRLEPGEDLEVVTVPVAEFVRLLRSGGIVDGKTIAAYTLWRESETSAGGGR